MKFTAPALANERFGIKFFTPHEPRYYYAKHRRENVECIWIEVKRLGHVFCYPYAINDHGKPYEYGNSQNPANFDNNDALIKRWNEVISPERLEADWTWKRVEEDEFRAIRDRITGSRDDDDDTPALEEGTPETGDEKDSE